MHAQIIDEPIEKLFNWVIAVLLPSHCFCDQLREEERQKREKKKWRKYRIQLEKILMKYLKM